MRSKKITFAPNHKLSFSILGRIKLSRLFSMGEEEFSSEIEKLEKNPIFLKLKSLGVIFPVRSGNFIEPTKKFESVYLRNTGETPSELLDSDSDIINLIRKMGEKRFKEIFLEGENLSYEELYKEFALKPKEIKRIKELVNSIYIAQELKPSPAPFPEKYYSCVGTIKIENTKPAIAFFTRDIWENIYKVNDLKLEELKSSLKPKEKQKIENLIKKIKFIEERKSSLYKLLKFLISYQKTYLLSGELSKLKPISQKEVSIYLKIERSVLSRMLSNKSIELPWGTEVKIKDLIPGKKKINKERVYSLIYENPELSDWEIARKLMELFNVKLSRRSVNQYRNELKKNYNHK